VSQAHRSRASRQQSLRRELIVLLGWAVLITLLAIGAGVYAFVSWNEQRVWQGRQSEAAHYASHTLSSFLQRTQDSLILVGALDCADLGADAQVLVDLLEHFPALLEIIRLNKDGRTVASANRTGPVLENLFTIPQSRWFVRAREGHSFLSSVQISASDEPYVIVALPSPDGGVVAARLRFSVLWDVVAHIEFGGTGQAYVVNQEGQIVAHTRSEVALSRTNLSGRPELTAMLQAPGHQWNGTYTNFEGKRVMGVSGQVADTEWIVITELSRSEASAVSRMALSLLSAGILLFGILEQWVISRFTGRLIFGPMEQLRLGAQRIGQGDMHHRIPILRDDEVGQIAKEFNEMVSRLREHGEQLAERTSELMAEVIERKRAEQELYESELRYRTLVESAPVGIGLETMSGQAQMYNPTMLQMTGYSMAELAQINLSETYQNPQDRGLLIQRLQEDGLIRDWGAALRRKDGTPYYADLTVTPVSLDGEQVLMTVAVDVTERRQAEVARVRLVAAVEQAADAIFMLNDAGRVQYVNPAFEHITGYARQDIEGRTVDVLENSTQNALFHREAWQMLREGKAWQGHFAGRRKDGSTFEAEGSIWPVRDARGQVVDYVVTVHDVTQRMALEAQLRQSQKMEAVGQLAGGVAHDFNNLLTAMMGYIDFIANDLPGESPLRDDLGQVERLAERAAALTRQLLAFSRKQMLKPQVLDLNDVVNDMHKMLRRLIREDIKLVTVLVPDLGQIKADPGQLGQVIMNLAVNARDAMPQGGILTVRTANVDLDDAYTRSRLGVTPGPYAMLSVTDTGIGMTEEVKARIFEPFFTTKAKGKGTGLGLATAYGIVKQSGGHIEVDSALNAGSVFRIYLPRLPQERALSEKETVRQPLVRGAERILLVEDDDVVRAMTQRILERQGYRVLTSSRPSEALQVFETLQEPVHLLLTDVVMPGMGGRALADQLTAVRPDMKVLYMSGYTDDAIVHQGVLDPTVAFLHKPFTPTGLARKVRKVLDGS
jgi:PAS domain S-box-containing protein